MSSNLTQIKLLLEELSTALKHRKLFLSTAESCTGGGLSYYLTSLAGCSEWFERGFITYSNNAKIEMLKVKASTLEHYGAVSRETAQEMAEGALAHSAADIAIAITGIAGPDGGTKEKPVGTVYLGLASKQMASQTELLTLTGDRKIIRELTIIRALKKLLETVMMTQT